MEPEVSLPCSQEPSAGPYPEPDDVQGNVIPDITGNDLSAPLRTRQLTFNCFSFT